MVAVLAVQLTEECRPGVDVQNWDAEPLPGPTGPVPVEGVLDRVRPGDHDDLTSGVRRDRGREGGQRVVLGHLADGLDADLMQGAERRSEGVAGSRSGLVVARLAAAQRVEGLAQLPA